MQFLSIFFSGFATAAFLASALFFLKFWRASRDFFFLAFSAVFALLATERIVGALVHAITGSDQEYLDGARHWIYLFRLVAFLILLTAIYRRNRNQTKF